MPTKPRPLPPAGNRAVRARPVAVTALLSSRQLSDGELRRAIRVLAAEGLGDIRASRILLTEDDARGVAAGDERAVPASMIDDAPLSRADDPAVALRAALAAARRRGDVRKDALLSDPQLLNTAAMAELLGMSEEGVRLKRKRHEVLGLEFAKRGIRYPAWQVLEGGHLVPELPRLFAVLGDDPWRLFRFLQQHHNELGGARAFEALRNGRVDDVIAAAENTATGAFA